MMICLILFPLQVKGILLNCLGGCEHIPLPPTFTNSLCRLKGQLRKLKKEPEVLQIYDNIIKGQLKGGIIEKVAELEASERQHYLPHQAVVRENAETTKVRIVYDASSKGGKTALKPQLNIVGCRYWLDSKTALYWINNAGYWKQIFQHRVDEILKVSEKENWGHCPGACNTAD